MTLTLEAGIKVTGDPQLLSNLNFVGGGEKTQMGPKKSKDASNINY